MGLVKISHVSEPGNRRWRSIKLAQSGEQICRGGWRGIKVCSEQYSGLRATLGSITAICSLRCVWERPGSDALLRGVVGLSQGRTQFSRRQQRAHVSRRSACACRLNRAVGYEKNCRDQPWITETRHVAYPFQRSSGVLSARRLGSLRLAWYSHGMFSGTDSLEFEFAVQDSFLDFTDFGAPMLKQLGRAPSSGACTSTISALLRAMAQRAH
jgi:hypothetical protein